MATYMMIPPEIIFSRFVFIVVLFTLACTKLLWNHLKVPKDNPQVCRAWTVFRNIRPHQTDPGGGTYFCDISSLCFVSQFVSTQMETALTISRANQSHVSCVRVRGRTNIFCADQGFWSEWTQDCFSGMELKVNRVSSTSFIKPVWVQVLMAAMGSAGVQHWRWDAALVTPSASSSTAIPTALHLQCS